mmetsp:Transcript_7058/g.10115  ORF Transcript_7058/g.10115 Transcript_7058/m.10115 type:complete len:440 (-) Transcript_7058:70-1389(-)
MTRNKSHRKTKFDQISFFNGMMNYPTFKRSEKFVNEESTNSTGNRAPNGGIFFHGYRLSSCTFGMITLLIFLLLINASSINAHTINENKTSSLRGMRSIQMKQVTTATASTAIFHLPVERRFMQNEGDSDASGDNSIASETTHNQENEETHQGNQEKKWKNKNKNKGNQANANNNEGQQDEFGEVQNGNKSKGKNKNKNMDHGTNVDNNGEKKDESGEVQKDKESSGETKGSETNESPESNEDNQTKINGNTATENNTGVNEENGSSTNISADDLIDDDFASNDGIDGSGSIYDQASSSPTTKPVAMPETYPQTYPLDQSPNDSKITETNEKSGPTEEELEMFHKIELHDEEKVGGWAILIGLTFMIFTAYQMSENPDGVFASICRLAITVTECIFKILLYPCRKAVGNRFGSYSTHHLVTSHDYGEPYSVRQHSMGII